MVEQSELVVYAGGDHGLCTTHKDRVNEDIWRFITGNAAVRAA